MTDKKTYQNFLYDLGLLIKEYALEASVQANKAKEDDRAFNRGIVFGFMRVISLMQDQARAFGIQLEELRLDDFDPERELL